MALVGMRRSWLAVVAVLGLVGSLLAVGVVPAAAADGEADNGAAYSACVGPALESLGLVDVVGSFAEDAVNCLGHYGITRGRTATTYDPGAPVLRWQMALFLTRAAGPAGVSLLADPADDFTDLGAASDETRSAINQMAGLEIMPGTGSVRFSPDTAVSRAQMAEMLDAFLGKARRGAGAFGGEDKLSDVDPDDTVFTDIGGVTRGQYSAIRRMFEVGVTRGTSDNQFSPGGLVTRAQMAAFITRMLAHTVARPAGLTMQANKLSVAGTADSPSQDVDLVVSLRDSAHMGMPDASVDLFKSTNPGDAFGSDGRCSNDEVELVGNGGGLCEIASSDETTNSDGDVEIAGGDVSFGASATVWAWAGDVGDRFDADDTVSASLEITVTKPATKLRITDDMAVNATAVQFGDRVTFVVQVVDDDGNPVATKDVSVTVAANTTVASGADGAGEQTSGVTNTHKTDDSGKIELSYRQTDPRTSGSDHGGDRAWLDLDITYSGTDYELEDKTTLKKAKDPDDAMVENAAVVWRDGTPVATTLTLAQAVSFHEADQSGSGASNTVTATLVDQYGDPVSRQRVEFTSDDVDGIGAKAAAAGAPAVLVFDIASVGTRLLTGDAALTRTTNRRGVASLTYNRDSSDGGIETIQAKVKIGSGATAKTIEAERAYHYWAEEPGVGDTASGRLVASDTDNNQLVLAGTGVSLVKYDSNDHFTTPDGAATLSAFETDLRDNAKHASVSNYQTASKNVSRFTTAGAWASLDHPGGMAAIEADSRFGQAFAVDDEVIVVGASHEAVDHDADPSDSTPAVSLSLAGMVYVYPDGITEADSRVELKSPSPMANGYFGYDVDISGNTIVVGEPGANKAYIYVEGDSGWPTSPTATLTGVKGDHDDDPATADIADGVKDFGRAVVISGDGKTIAVASPGESRGPTPNQWTINFEGRLFVYPKPGTGGADPWVDQMSNASALKELALPVNTWNIDAIRFRTWWYERSLAISNDGSVILHGHNDLKHHDYIPGGLAHPGAILVHVRSGATWSDSNTPSVLRASERSRNQAVGKYVAISGDGNVIVASGHYRAGERKPGETLVFTKPAGGWANSTEPAVLTVEGGRTSDVLGQYIAIKSDGSEIAASRHYRQEGDWRGSVVTYTKPSSGGWVSDDSPDNEYLGIAPRDKLGWQTTYDKSDGDLYSGIRRRTDTDEDNYYYQNTIFRIDR